MTIEEQYAKRQRRCHGRWGFAGRELVWLYFTPHTALLALVRP